ncbi:hypothetical protein AAU57_12560 [Nonlabens sp. YIK11]|nr:hypothetical protein AAU57_12560 [Nonlabens sp. YIK11]
MNEKKILIITSILRLPIIDKNEFENDILFKIEDELTKRDPNISFEYLFVLPKIPLLLFFLESIVRLMLESSTQLSFLIRKFNLIFLIKF